MKKYSLSIALAALVSAGAITGCKKALDVAPTESIDANIALSTKEGINAAVNGIFSRLKDARLYGRDLIALPEVLADNGYATNRSGRLFAESNNQNRAHFTDATWQLLYKNINEANLILENSGSAPVTASERSSIEGQAYFVRALCHLNVALVYAYMPGAEVSGQSQGGVPLLLKGTNTIAGALASVPGRAPIDTVYAQIVRDFEAANARLTLSGVSPFTFPNYASKQAAQAMLSRVNLYRKNYSEAKRWSDSSITNSGSRLTSGSAYVTNWRNATHGETLFQVAFVNNNENIGVNESLQTTFTTLNAPGGTTTTGFGDVVASLFMLDSLGITLNGGNNVTNYKTAAATIASRSSDVRNQLYEPGTAGRGKPYVEVTKYIGKNGFVNLDNAPVIRIAEVYLNRAEAQATPGSPVFDQAAALVDLNKILVARGLPAVALAGSALLDEIGRQRRIELAFEGHRLWDLKRTRRDIMKAPVFTGGDVPFIDTRILAPIPTQEIQVNPNIKQNAGY
ncbi:RagB/SusD family nutrient uptake outer membrane protein [Flaviaesturariibacter flavus]|uniref:RagB/SusD family nutrient uptake outer membrane protein n=1 Tax=Flaviaesturariibacter flavus TaxID=2502780 RepID=A0A4R1BAW6_9BACT|nr:RagB/SusD family nutrient uptake outer membrane protein [Flaviaesturariibacter flavus]TCJ14087.1 RagB/SusD family nutrient uptake outer membrane protein [Flaviaesturariibacter flavus]